MTIAEKAEIEEIKRNIQKLGETIDLCSNKKTIEQRYCTRGYNPMYIDKFTWPAAKTNSEEEEIINDLRAKESKGEKNMPYNMFCGPDWGDLVMADAVYSTKVKLSDIPTLSGIDDAKKEESIRPLPCTPISIPQIKDYRIYNDKVLVVWFVDGTATKAVAEDGDKFDFYTGLVICLFKRAISEKDGSKTFNRMMRQVIKRTEDIDKEKLEKIEEAAKKKEKRQKAEKKRKAREERAAEWAIDIHSQAYARAFRELGMDRCICSNAKEDDLK